jgi:hypothetical protein
MVTHRTVEADVADGAAWAGWIVFAGAMLLMIGVFNIFEGIVALVDDQRVVITPQQLLVVDLTGWGWTLLISGAVMVAAGLGLFTAQTWARVTAIIIVILHALIQIAWLGAYPVWSLLMIALDTVVLFALCARWPAAQRELGAYDSAYEGRAGQHTSVG